MEEKEHNGWSNYATWRVALEMFDGLEIDHKWSDEECESYVEEILDQQCESGLVRDYANSFLADVDWREIAESVNEQLEHK